MLLMSRLIIVASDGDSDLLRLLLNNGTVKQEMAGRAGDGVAEHRGSLVLHRPAGPGHGHS